MRRAIRSIFRGAARSQQGAVSMIMAMTLLVIAGVSALAVDAGYIYSKRGELQKAADIGALAGAQVLPMHGNDLAAVRAVALEYARKNLEADDDPTAAVTDADVVFYRDGVADTTDPNQVEVTVNRRALRDNSLELLLGPALGKPFADVWAQAIAGSDSICSSKCIKPFIIPAHFDWDDTCEGAGSAFTGNGEMDTESPCELASVDVQGYTEENAGEWITLKPGEPQLAVVPSHYNLIDLPPKNKGTPVTGASAVHENIIGCTGSNSQTSVEPGDEMQLEPGNTVGPVRKGVQEVIGMDPYAYWDEAANSMEGSVYDDPMESPRTAIIAVYDPRNPPVSGRNSVFVHQLAAVFLDSVDSQGNVYARFINAVAQSPEDADGDCMLRMTRILPDTTTAAN